MKNLSKDSSDKTKPDLICKKEKFNSYFPLSILDFLFSSIAFPNFVNHELSNFPYCSKESHNLMKKDS